ncbi:MAG TPA: hypothetical protein VMF31_12155 [Solirubrobacterales bacterium]|nr:hypothetical protein [Solirubrobacterales bacterium]
MKEKSPDPESAGTVETKQTTLLLEVTRAEMAESFRISEVLDAKARTLPQISTVFFAASQVAITFILTGSEEPVPAWLTVTALALGVLGLIAVAACLVRVVRVQTPVDQAALKVEVLNDRLFSFAADGDERVSRFMLQEMTDIVVKRRKENSKKAKSFKRTQLLAYAAIAISGLQLMLGLALPLIVS